jgi:TolB-like protein
VKNRTLRFLACWIALLAAAGPMFGCGYKLAGANTFLPERIRAIGVAPFENRTRRPEIDQRLTEQVAREFSKRGEYSVVTDTEEADAWLEGAVADFRTQPVQFNEQGRATRLETVVRIEATLRDLGTGEILWNQSSLVFREQYDVSEQETELSPGGTADEPFFDRETLALDQIARGAAGALVTSILEGF